MDNVGGRTEPVMVEESSGPPTWSVGIAISFYDASVLESHAARLTAHSSNDWGAHVEIGSARKLTVCIDPNLVGGIQLHDLVWSALLPDDSAQF
jgi:hypothetical protein